MNDVNDQDIIKKSVTAGDTDPYNGGAVIRYILPWNFWGITSEDTLPQSLPSYWTPKRDYYLRSTLYHEDFWAGAVSIACTKVASKSWQIEGDIPLRVRRSQEIMQTVNFHGGWVNFMSQTAMDDLCTDNGWFVEIVRASTALGSQILGLVHLDALRVIRTGDPDIPVVYRDRKGREHELKSYQVISGADLPDPGETWYGIGHCAAERSYKTIIKQAAIETYIYEKVSGRRPKELHFVNVNNEKQIRNAIAVSQDEADQKGAVAYMGAVIVPVPGDKAPGVASIQLAGLPEDFDRKIELDISLLAYGNNIGLDPQDLQPLTGQSLGSGAQSQVLDDKAEGKGLQAFMQDFVHAMNWWVLPDLTSMIFVEKDYRDRMQKATIAKVEIEGQGVAVQQGVTTPRQAMQYLVDEHIYPKEFIPQDETPETDLSDVEKPGDETSGSTESAVSQQAAPVPAPVAKEMGDAAALIEAETEAAAKLYKDTKDAKDAK